MVLLYCYTRHFVFYANKGLIWKNEKKEGSEKMYLIVWVGRLVIHDYSNDLMIIIWWLSKWYFLDLVSNYLQYSTNIWTQLIMLKYFVHKYISSRFIRELLTHQRFLLITMEMRNNAVLMSTKRKSYEKILRLWFVNP